jgi:glucosamine-6-phosphate deaminase
MSERAAATKLRVFESSEAIGEFLAGELLGRIEQSRQSGARFLLGCPTGRTPRPIYGALSKLVADTEQDLSHVTLVMMDEYVVRSRTGFEPAPAAAPWSCHHSARVDIADRLNDRLSPGRRLKDSAVWFPDPNDPPAYDEKIAHSGGIDFFILASGASDGHVAFNPPGSPRESRTRIIELPESTRRDNLQTFPAFGSLESVPTHGISVGIATITAARQAVMVLWGKSKALSLARIQSTTQYDTAWPATVVHECAGARILTDAEAAEENDQRP